MIYLDNAATTLHKPPEVAEAVKQAILTAGNASRGAHGAVSYTHLSAFRRMLCKLYQHLYARAGRKQLADSRVHALLP